MSEDIKTPDSQVDVDEVEKTDAEQDNLDQVEGIEATASDAARPEDDVLEDVVAEANDNHDNDERTDNASEPAGEEADTDEQIEPGKEDGQHDSTSLALDGVPVLDDVSTTASDTENIPRFLTRDQYEQVGDDPDPLPSGFEVIDGGISAAGGAQTPTVPDEESAPKEALPAKPEDGAAQAVAKAGAAIADAAASVGTMLSQGMGAVREVSAARRAHSEARDHLDELSQVIEENEDEETSVQIEQEGKRKLVWQRKIETACDRYKLSPREREVLRILLKGRDAKYIMDQFYISQSTAKTHIYNIYRKFGIHSRQDLYDFIEDIELAEDE